MDVLSNGFMFQAEAVQLDRWNEGPLELVEIPVSRVRDPKLRIAVHNWNQTHAAGQLRGEDSVEALTAAFPRVMEGGSPNLIFVPTRDEDGLSPLDLMLAELLPDEALSRVGFHERPRCLLSLTPFGLEAYPTGRRADVRDAFSREIWKRLAPRARFHEDAFAPRSSLRLIAGDARFWMHRLYRIALDRREALFRPCADDADRTWRPLETLRRSVLSALPAEDHHRFEVRRPMMGGTIWDGEDADQRDDVLRSAVDGDGVIESIEPVVETLLSDAVDSDFSDRTSWIREDFERRFHHKRARLKVAVLETVDDAPVWGEPDAAGYGHVLYRDVLSFLDVRQKKLVIALRLGKSASDIARDAGLRGHASIARQIARLKRKVARILDC